MLKRCLPIVMVSCLLLYSGGSALAETIGEKIDKIEKKIPEVKVKETVINVSPEMKIYLPNGSLDLNLRQRYEKTTIDFGSRYDFVDNLMGFNLDFLYDINPYSLGINFEDRVDFNLAFFGSQYLQRSQSVEPYALYILTPSARFKTGLRFENTYTDAVATATRIEQGKNIVGEVGVYDDTIINTGPTPTGGRTSLRLLHSFRNLGSDFDYTKAEFFFKRFFYPYANHYVDFEFQTGYPLDTGSSPLTSLYYTGGYRTMRGYQFREFAGTAMIYSFVAYNFPLSDKELIINEDFAFSVLTLNTFVEGAKIGDRGIYDTFSNTIYDAGFGVGYRINLFNRFPLTIEVSAAKAFEDRSPLYYFTLSTLYYTWRN